VPVPQGAGAVISDPVRGKVSDEAGSLPKAPEPARIDVLTNPSARQAVSTLTQNISTGIVAAVSGARPSSSSSAAPLSVWRRGACTLPTQGCGRYAYYSGSYSPSS